MDEETGSNREISNKKDAEDMQSKKANKNNLKIVISFFLLLLIVTVIIVGYLYQRESDYEKGVNLYKSRKYTEALYEFQKVDPDNKNFNNAQSKINYINGLMSFNEGREQEAAVFLSKVKPDDEYYNDARLMLETMNETSTGNDLPQTGTLSDNKDTVIIKKEFTGTPKKVVEPPDPKKQEDLELSKKYVSDAANYISRFESTYQATKPASLSSKSDYGKSLESVNKEFNNLKYTAQNKDAGVVELKRMIGEWMSKRIAFIRQLISEHSVNETDKSRPLREEGDRLYTAMMNQMSKVKKSF
jgi:tetratricopeptide (TPR) repeat protein